MATLRAGHKPGGLRQRKLLAGATGQRKLLAGAEGIFKWLAGDLSAGHSARPHSQRRALARGGRMPGRGY